MAFGAPSLKGRALRYLSQREHSRSELERKLARHAEEAEGGSAAAQIAQAIDELAARGLQSEARAAESVLVANGPRMGVRRLKQALQAKGLKPELVADQLRAAEATELERARELFVRRFGAPAPDAAGRAKQARFLVARGFGGDVVRRIVLGRDADD
jgi:regulatory protein